MKLLSSMMSSTVTNSSFNLLSYFVLNGAVMEYTGLYKKYQNALGLYLFTLKFYDLFLVDILRII